MTPTIFSFLVLAAGLLASGPRAVYVLMVLCLFGAASAIALPAGATITPAAMFIPFPVARGSANEAQRAVCARWPIKSRLLAATWAVRGRGVDTNADRTALFGPSTQLMPLGPVSTNITQSAYAVGGVGIFAAMSALLAEKGRLAKFRDAVLMLPC